MSGRIFPWFHGKLSRDEVESRLKAVCAGRDYDDVVYLVREKSDSDRDLVLSWMNVKTQSATHFVVKMMGAGSDKMYVLDAQVEGRTSYFSEIQELLDHFHKEDGGFPGGPLSFAVPSPAPCPLPEPEGISIPPPETGGPAPDFGNLRINPNNSRRASQLMQGSSSSPVPAAGSPNAPPPIPTSRRPHEAESSDAPTPAPKKKGCILL